MIVFSEIKNFQRALVEYSIDNSDFPDQSEFDKKTLEPLISDGYLKVNSITRLCRDNEIHSYKYDKKKGSAFTWHCHPKLLPYDKGPHKVVIEGDGVVGEVSVLTNDEATKELIRAAIEKFIAENQILKIPVDVSMMGMVSRRCAV